jgi:hypothetical protein
MSTFSYLEGQNAYSTMVQITVPKKTNMQFHNLLVQNEKAPKI